MSISAKPWDSAGGGASVPDASETTKGIIEIATSAEATTGTDDLKAMTPLTVKERIDAALVGGVEYKGIFSVTSATPDLSSAEKGDMYIVSGSGTLYGKAWAVGDHLIINADMGGSISNSKIDKVDNTEQVTSVNAQTGAVSLSGNDLDGDHTASNYSTTSDRIEKHLEGIDNKFGTLGTASTSASTDFQPVDAGLTSISGLTTAADKMIYTSGSDTYAVTDLTSAGRALLDDASASAQRTTLGLGSAALSASTDFQPIDAGLTSISGLTTAADKMIYTSGSDTYAVADLTSAGRALLDDANASAQRTTLGLGSAALKDAGDQANEVLLLNGSGQIPAVDGSLITGITATDSTKLAIASNLSDLNNAGTARTNLGVAIGSNVQAHDAGLDSISGLTTAADKMIYTSGSDTYAVTDLTSAGRALLDDANASAQRTTLGLGSAALSASTDFQPIDAGLTSISGLTTAADKMIYTSGSDTYAVTDLTSAGRALLDDANASAQRTTLGLVIGTDVSAIASPAFTGSPTAPTQSQSDGSTKLATTAYVDTAVSGGGGSAPTLTTLTATSNQTHTLSAPSAGVIEDVYKINNTTYNVTIALVASATVGSGFKYQLKRLGTGTVSIDPDGSETIDHAGRSTLAISAQYDSITLMSDGSNWIII